MFHHLIKLSLIAIDGKWLLPDVNIIDSSGYGVSIRDAIEIVENIGGLELGCIPEAGLFHLKIDNEHKRLFPEDPVVHVRPEGF
jgi:hypothetical protein